MRLKTFFLSFIVILTTWAGINFAISIAQRTIVQRVSTIEKLHKEAIERGHLLRKSSDDLARLSRRYVIKKSEIDKINYNYIISIRNGDLPYPENYSIAYWDLVSGGVIKKPKFKTKQGIPLEQRVLELDLSVDEYAKYREARAFANKLSRLEQHAMHMVDGYYDDGSGAFTKHEEPDQQRAIDLVFGEEYLQLKSKMMEYLRDYDQLIELRTANLARKYDGYSRFLLDFNIYMSIFLIALLVVSICIMIMHYYSRFSKIMTAIDVLKMGDASISINVSGNDEIGKLASAINMMITTLQTAMTQLQTRATDSEKEKLHTKILLNKSDSVIKSIMPASIASRMLNGEQLIAETYPEVTVLFADIVGFTTLSANLGPDRTIRLLNDIFGMLDKAADQYNLEKIKTIGDCYMVVGGVPKREPLHCQNAALFGLLALSLVKDYSEKTGISVRLRIGMHTGTVAAGVIGRSKLSFDIWGDTVNQASRFESSGLPDKIHASESVHIRLQDDFNFEARGDIELKGKGYTKSWFLVENKTQPTNIPYVQK